MRERERERERERDRDDSYLLIGKMACCISAVIVKCLAKIQIVNFDNISDCYTNCIIASHSLVALERLWNLRNLFAFHTLPLIRDGHYVRKGGEYGRPSGKSCK